MHLPFLAVWSVPVGLGILNQTSLEPGKLRMEPVCPTLEQRNWPGHCDKDGSKCPMSSGVGMAPGLQQDPASEQELSLVTSSGFASKAIYL